MGNLYSTGDLYDIVSRSESFEEYKPILDSLEDQKTAWKEVIAEIMQKNGYNATALGKLCGVSRQSAQKWAGGAVPKSRSTFIKIGFAAGYDLNQMDRFLQRYGCCNKLYPKNLEDSVCIFVLSSDEMDHTYANCEMIIDMIKKEMEASDESSADENFETSSLEMELMKMKSLPQLLMFISEKSALYKTTYRKFYEYVESYIQKNLLPEGDDNVFLLANAQGWSSSLRQCVSEISQKKWYPQRTKIISLGIHLNMNVDEINTMLNLAQMEDLCAKTPFENAIIYALENAALEDMIHCDGTTDLCLYVKDILEKLHIDGTEAFLDELPDEDTF